jgi:hypothetical protein
MSGFQAMIPLSGAKASYQESLWGQAGLLELFNDNLANATPCRFVADCK